MLFGSVQCRQVAQQLALHFDHLSTQVARRRRSPRRWLVALVLKASPGAPAVVASNAPTIDAKPPLASATMASISDGVAWLTRHAGMPGRSGGGVASA